MTTSGTIQGFHKQIDNIKAITNKSSTQTIYTLLNACKRLGLLHYTDGNIYLCSWEDCVKKTGISLEFKEKLTFVQYEITDLQTHTATPEYLIEAAEIAECTARMKNVIVKRIDSNESLKQILGITGKPTIKDTEKLFHLQVQTFIGGDSTNELYDTIHSIQACPYRNNTSLIKARKQKRLRSTVEHIAYVKQKLIQTGIAKVSRLTFKSNKLNKPNLTYWYKGWDKATKKTMWYLPDLIEVNATMPEGL